ncbi:DoxX family protein [Mycolicibacterium smegmatis]|jgi:putative oxidoreductase|uniref:Integral membrane protein n=3 Tax=Mycolicibacterium smegmatis TaxID=1772 RepID=A0R081_MYCS2|nr:DoxX family protein [Mycolicibacterium smegmatis]ABK70348.1 integral membrane protein [Mycolicibacterium smegmatis MC2 155]AFP40648.1 Conserved integral membrane protein [Mycolicibacterium smegmatis MC2 155]AIU09383.1 phosphoribosylaminoimidazolecarboxamide formyltransferase [Mycolicibacterium smegmatis MC2 155]AIU16008.1 phosphoribosylaminoimidazolecarboxamide formyltransferase [Mycolicibacterium smegmatis]AIU22631.1 phosphoribosylaminoimidazolecarboxamide formyltransferase [Mycolicibacter
MTTNLDTRLATYSPVVVAIFRIVFGFLFAVHGASKLFAWPVDSGSGAVPVGTWPYWYAGVIELVLGLLIMVGLFTRIAAFIASGHMAVAYFWQHQPKGLLPLENGGEPTVLFCFGFLLLFAIGGGAFALDAARAKR